MNRLPVMMAVVGQKEFNLISLKLQVLVLKVTEGKFPINTQTIDFCLKLIFD